MTKPKREFKPTHYLDITSVVSLHIEIVKSDGQYYVHASYYDGLNKYFDKVTRSVVRADFKGHTYFVKSNQRFYLADFLKKTPF